MDSPRPTIGLPPGKVQVVPYEAHWPELFREEAARLRAALGSAIGEIEHIGSTAVPGLSAKPIIDVLVAVERFEAAHELVPVLECLGYEYCPSDPTPGRLFFTLGSEDCRTHHLSLTEAHSAFWREHLAFRDYLRSYAEAAAQYVELKLRLADSYADDRPAYSAAKRDFIDGIHATLKRGPQTQE